MITLRDDRRLLTLLYAAIALLMVGPFVADLLVPLGTSVWVIYLLPAALAFLGNVPLLPLGLALAATILTAIGFVWGNPGIDPSRALINRTVGMTTVWLLGVTGFYFVRSKLATRAHAAVQAAEIGLGETLRGELRPEQVAQNAIRFLAERMQAQAGALFVQQDEAYHRLGTFGVPADAALPATVRPGDGLLGQAIADRRSFRLEDVPEGYLYFGSGFGQARPRYLLIVPIHSDGLVNGVVELGFATQVTGQAQALLERLAPALSVAIRSARYRARLSELLEETRRQAEELRNQTEELQSANEELEEQSRALQDSQTRLELQQSELEQTNAQLEEQTQLLERQRDELEATQGALKTQAGELELASRYKSEFLANMSHELRTPLNSLLILARLLAENKAGNLSADQVKYARTIESSGNDLLNLINDVLDIAKIEAGKLELQPARLRVEALTRKLEALFQPQAAQKGLRFAVEIAEAAPRELRTDPQRLEQVLKNFLANALKFTDQGSVTLRIAGAGPGRIAFTVQDSGIGIAADQQQAIFEAFRQADGTINRRYGGTGLGLSVSRELATLLGGEIGVESEPGKGSAFTLTVPLDYLPSQPIERRPPLAEPVAPPRQQRTETRSEAGAQRGVNGTAYVPDDRDRLTPESRIILVVEDDEAFARILCDLAHELGFHVIATRTADEGVTAARQYLPHAVILDLGLPDHSGLFVLDRLKRDLRTRHIPVHVVSVSDYSETALAFGAVSYMLKPVRREELELAMEQLETRFAQHLRRVLIVEDDERQLESIRLLLASRDLDTEGARTAAEALAKLETQSYDCIVLDLSLPDASGFDFLEELSNNEGLAFPPVIVYTGRDISADDELRLRKYSKSIIIKGAKSPERLLDEVTLFLHQVVSELPEQQQKLLARSLNRDASLEGRHILVVEDDIRNVYALTSVFEPHGAQLSIARNGLEALDLLKRGGNGKGPIDLVLMDVMMPEMDGLTATREIRSQPEWRNLPIITLTAKAMAQDQEQCLAAGANDYIAKPLDVDKLLSLVRVWMPR